MCTSTTIWCFICKILLHFQFLRYRNPHRGLIFPSLHEMFRLPAWTALQSICWNTVNECYRTVEFLLKCGDLPYSKLWQVLCKALHRISEKLHEFMKLSQKVIFFYAPEPPGLLAFKLVSDDEIHKIMTKSPKRSCIFVIVWLLAQFLVKKCLDIFLISIAKVGKLLLVWGLCSRWFQEGDCHPTNQRGFFAMWWDEELPSCLWLVLYI